LGERFDTDIGLDCSPFAPPTHWKQTVVSVPEYVEVSERQVVLNCCDVVMLFCCCFVVAVCLFVCVLTRERGQPVLCALRLEQEPLSARHYSCTVEFAGFDGHELDCECFKCQLVRGE
jgi:hypothetical protein